MKLRLLLCLSAILLIFAASVPARAQTGANPPPTIIRFGADLPVITLEDAEAGETAAILSWRTVGMVGDYRLRLDAFQMHGWASLLAEGEPPLDAVGRLPIIVQHPLTFAPPTYRLQIVDAAGHVVDERIAVVPYDLESVTEPPAVESFTAGATSVDVNALARGEARIPVSWRAVNRPPAANLVFEQVLASGQSVSAELPRDTLWVASAGSGTVAPILPGSERTITLRLRLVDLENGETLAQQEISLSVTGTLATPTPLPTTPPPPTPVAARPTATFSPPPPPPANAPVIVSFTVTPNLVDRGGQVTVSWQVTGASDVTVWRLEPAGRLAESVGAQPLIGAWTLVLQNDYTDSAVFYLVATGANGARSEATATVLVRCPYTYFFGATPAGEGCPFGPPQDVSGAFQPFQGGYMLWRADTRQIFVLANGGQLSRFTDTWVDGEPIPTVEAPPPGLEAPARGFGKVWALTPSVRQVLGWPSGIEQSYTMRTQQSGAYRYPRLYMTLPDGRIVYVVESNWGFVP